LLYRFASDQIKYIYYKKRVDNRETQATLGARRRTKIYKKRVDNRETQATLGERRRTKTYKKRKMMSNTNPPNKRG